MRKNNWKKILLNGLWILAGIGTMVLLGAAMQQKNQRTCTDIAIEITGVEQHMFIDEKDVLEMLHSVGRITGSRIGSLDLRQMESLVEKDPWVKNAEMFLDNNQSLQVKIEERQPVARVFTLGGNSFYLDSNALRLPLSEKLSARVPVFTGFPSDRSLLAKPDSMLLNDIVSIGKYILADSFWMAQVAQVDITPGTGFELVPVLGDHTVMLGNVEDLDRKFRKLSTFYHKAWLQNGINTYEKLDIQYDNQVVAIRKGISQARIDSAKAHALMQGMLQQPIQGLPDSNRISSPVPVVKKDREVKKPVVTTALKPVAKANSATVTNNKVINKSLTNVKKAGTKKAVQKKPAARNKKPKAVMTRNQ
ncbi:MAG: hypothetical protein HYU71_08615 [Bacteroidetes bacterium]|nr:hypothetical protein [Bacteroidota bacterium]